MGAHDQAFIVGIVRLADLVGGDGLGIRRIGKKLGRDGMIASVHLSSQGAKVGVGEHFGAVFLHTDERPHYGMDERPQDQSVMHF